MVRVLSTRILTPEQRLLLPDSVELVAYDALEVTCFPVAQDWSAEDLLVFTSRNAVRACFAQKATQVNSCYCVGSKTAEALREAGQEVLGVYENAGALAQALIQENTKQNIIFFCGNRRLDTLPEALAQAGIPMETREVYATTLVQKKFGQNFDALLFFSPSGVAAFTSANPIGKALAVCIGPTTAAAAKKYTNRYCSALHPSVEAVLQTLISEMELQP